MNLKNYLLIIYLPLLVLLLTSCQMLNKANRKPQSAGFKGYCSTCLVEGINKEVSDLKNTAKLVFYNKVEQLERRKKNKERNTRKYTIKIGGKCADGFVEGRRFKYENYLYGRNGMECLPVNKLYSKYEVSIHGSCAKGYIEGKYFVYKSIYKPVNHYKECHLKSKLPDKYEVHAKGKCAKGYTEGTMFTNKSFLYADEYNSKECFLIDKLPNKYEVHVKGKCAKGYTEGTIFENSILGDDYHDSKECISIRNYIVGIKERCAEGYVEGRQSNKRVFNRNYEGKDCIHKSKLNDEYDVHSKGKCAEGYTVIITNNPSTDNKKCVLSHTIEK